MTNMTADTAVQHLLFFFLVVVTPIWDYYDTCRLKRSPQSDQKIRYYQTLSAWLWIATGIACLAVGLRPLLIITPLPGEAAWLFGHAWVRCLMGAAIALFMALVLLPAVIAIWKNMSKKPRKYSSADAFKSLKLFPSRDVGRAPVVRLLMYHRRNLRRDSVSGISVALPACLSFFDQPDTGIAVLFVDLWAAAPLPGRRWSLVIRRDWAAVRPAVPDNGKPAASLCSSTP